MRHMLDEIPNTILYIFYIYNVRKMYNSRNCC